MGLVYEQGLYILFSSMIYLSMKLKFNIKLSVTELEEAVEVPVEGFLIKMSGACILTWFLLLISQKEWMIELQLKWTVDRKFFPLKNEI